MNIDLDDVQDIKRSLDRIESLAEETQFKEMLPNLAVIRKVINFCIKRDSFEQDKKEKLRSLVLKTIRSSGRKGASMSDISISTPKEKPSIRRNVIQELIEKRIIYAMKKETEESNRLKTFYFISK